MFFASKFSCLPVVDIADRVLNAARQAQETRFRELSTHDWIQRIDLYYRMSSS